MKTLFIDFDGVLHPNFAGMLSEPGEPVEITLAIPELFIHVPRLAEIIQPYNVEVVVHSGWRMATPFADMLRLLSPIADRLRCTTAPNLTRYEGIRCLVEAEGIQDYRILDDVAGEFPRKLPELILCDRELGLSTPGVEAQLHSWLNR